MANKFRLGKRARKFVFVMRPDVALNLPPSPTLHSLSLSLLHTLIKFTYTFAPQNVAAAVAARCIDLLWLN